MATVDGLDGLLRKFNALNEVGRGEVMHRAAVSGAMLIVNEAKRNAPVKTGNLRRSIHVGGEPGLGAELSGADAFSDLGAGPITGDSATVFVGTNLEYAPYVEYGTSVMAAQPYLRPAFDSQEQAATKEMQAAFLELIEAASK